MKTSFGKFRRKIGQTHYCGGRTILLARPKCKTPIVSHMSGLDELRVFTPDGAKIRIGSHGDGGYVLLDGLTYDSMISCGISDDITFEKEFLEYYPIQCTAFDGTIQKLPEDISGVTFVKKNIGIHDTDTTTNLHTIIEPLDSVLLKMDIETYEYRWLQTLTKEQLQKFKQIIIEFHFPFTPKIFPNLDTPLPVEQKMDCLRRLADTHWLIHFHGNNCCGTTEFNGNIVPNVFECTYVRKDACEILGLNTIPLPTSLDAPNLLHTPDIQLNRYPFVHTSA